jgi:hypothetical protein
MEVSDGGLMSGSVWAIDRLIMYSPKTFDEKSIVENSVDLHNQMLGNAKSKFDNYNIFSGQMEGLDNIHSLAILSNGKIKFSDFEIEIDVYRGDLIAYRSDLHVDTNFSFIEKLFAYNNAPKTFGNGSKLYEITATIRDDYKISVYANNSEEALKVANDVSISEWRHPDVLEDSHLEDRRIIRHARWGNLSVNEIKD